MGRKAVLHLLTFLAMLFTALLLAAAVLSWRASFVSPEAGRFWATAAMLMPVLLLANAVALVWWLVRRRWIVALMPLAALAVNAGYISAMVQLPDFHDGDKSSDLTVGTLNVYGFRRLPTPGYTVHSIANMVEEEGVDVLCMQEFMAPGKLTIDSIATFFAPRLPYFIGETTLAVASRFPILGHHYVKFEDTDNAYLWADMLFEGDTVRVFSVHLQTSGINGLRSRFRKDYNSDAPVELVVEELERNSRIRAGQVRQIRAAIDATPYPVIVAGDFNDTPSSYTYRQMKGELADGFQAAGNGYGGTFRYIGGILRIDYLFYDDNFRAVRYYTPEQDLSDHKAVVAGLRFKR